MTNIADVISQVMIYIDDIRLQQELAINPALFYRKMSQWFEAAMPMLSRPPELYHYVTNEYVPASYTDYQWVSTEDSISVETVVDTGITGYELCSVVQVSEDSTYSTAYSEATYNSETGEITFPMQTESGVVYDINFYNDGSVADLTPAQMRLMALAVVQVWGERFTNNWLNMQMKIKDNSFSTVNESNYIDKTTVRYVELRQAFNDELKKYEQDNAYENLVPKYLKYRTLR